MVLQRPFRLFISLILVALVTLQPRQAQPMVAGAAAVGGLVLKVLPLVIAQAGLTYGYNRWFTAPVLVPVVEANPCTDETLKGIWDNLKNQLPHIIHNKNGTTVDAPGTIQESLWKFSNTTAAESSATATFKGTFQTATTNTAAFKHTLNQQCDVLSKIAEHGVKTAPEARQAEAFLQQLKYNKNLVEATMNQNFNNPNLDGLTEKSETIATLESKFFPSTWKRWSFWATDKWNIGSHWLKTSISTHPYTAALIASGVTASVLAYQWYKHKKAIAHFDNINTTLGQVQTELGHATNDIQGNRLAEANGHLEAAFGRLRNVLTQFNFMNIKHRALPGISVTIDAAGLPFGAVALTQANTGTAHTQLNNALTALRTIYDDARPKLRYALLRGLIKSALLIGAGTAITAGGVALAS